MRGALHSDWISNSPTFSVVSSMCKIETPNVVSTDSGFTVVWLESCGGERTVRELLLDFDGVGISAIDLVASVDAAARPRIASIGDSRAITWQNGEEIWVASRSGLSELEQIVSYSFHGESHPEVSAFGENFIVVWRDFDGFNQVVRIAVLDAEGYVILTPEPIVVDHNHVRRISFYDDGVLGLITLDRGGENFTVTAIERDGYGVVEEVGQIAFFGGYQGLKFIGDGEGSLIVVWSYPRSYEDASIFYDEARDVEYFDYWSIPIVPSPWFGGDLVATKLRAHFQNLERFGPDAEQDYLNSLGELQLMGTEAIDRLVSVYNDHVASSGTYEPSYRIRWAMVQIISSMEMDYSIDVLHGIVIGSIPAELWEHKGCHSRSSVREEMLIKVRAISGISLLAMQGSSAADDALALIVPELVGTGLDGLAIIGLINSGWSESMIRAVLVDDQNDLLDDILAADTSDPDFAPEDVDDAEDLPVPSDDG